MVATDVDAGGEQGEEGTEPDTEELTPGPPLVTVLVRRGHEHWRPPVIAHYGGGEADLEHLLAESPDLLGEPDEKRAVVRQLGVPDTGTLDIAAVGPSGTISLIECKLRKNPEIKRKVIGQLFAYAAGLAGLSYEEFDQCFAARAKSSLAEAVKKAAGLDAGWDETSFRNQISENLDAGRFDLVFAVDSLPDEMKRTVRYLNQHTADDVRVFALELGYARDGDVEILVPSIYGEESAARKRTAPTKWDETAILAAVERKCTAAGLEAMHKLFEHAHRSGEGFSMGKGRTPAGSARYDLGSSEASVWTCFTDVPPRVEVVWGWIGQYVTEQKMITFAHLLGEALPSLKGRVAVPASGDFRRGSRIPIQELGVDDAAERFLQAVDEFLRSAREGNSTSVNRD